MKSQDTKGKLRLIGDKGDEEVILRDAGMSPSVLAKLAEDVIAWNRPITPTEVDAGARPAQVASLGSLSKGFKIRRKEELKDESSEGVVRLFHKDK